MAGPRIVAVNASARHTFSKPNQLFVRLVEGLGVEGDAHCGPTMKDDDGMIVPNIRQVHLIHAELFDEVAAKGFSVSPGQIGENITTEGLDILALPEGARLHLGEEAVIELTGLRAPCSQIDKFAKGLMKAVIEKRHGERARFLSGVMAVVVRGGEVRPGDGIVVVLPDGEQRALAPV